MLSGGARATTDLVVCLRRILLLFQVQVLMESTSDLRKHICALVQRRGHPEIVYNIIVNSTVESAFFERGRRPSLMLESTRL